MRSKSWWHRLFSKAAPQTAVSVSRIDVKPPSLWGDAEPVWAALLGRLVSSDKLTRAPQSLEVARTDFNAALAGLQSADAADLQRRASHARSLRELWHLRAELYNIIARHLSQGEADRRIAAVNLHFPQSASRFAASTLGRSDEQHVA